MEFNAVKAMMDVEQSTPLLILILSTALISTLILLMVNTISVKSGLQGKNLPPGNLGLPLIGETYQFLRAYKALKAKYWVEERVAKYGGVFKTSLMGCPTVVLTGQAGNRFLFHCDSNFIVSKQPLTVRSIFGKKSIFELKDVDHKRMRGAVMSFLKPEALQAFVGRMDSIIQKHFVDCWEGKQSITVVPLMKELTFQVACDLFFSLNDGEERDFLSREFTTAMKGMWALPLDFPGTSFRRALNARSRICKRLSSMLETRRGEIAEGQASPDQDLMSCLLCMRDENGCALTEEEITDNLIVIFIGGHETTSTLLTHLVRTLALNPDVYQNIIQEQTKVFERKQSKEYFTWEDIHKMKYTWKVAQETLRLIPPIFGGFKTTIRDVEYEGYTIPKGWQIFWETSTTHMNEHVFKEPQKFDPSHFDAQIPPYNFIAFGGGPRICPGYNFSKIETILFLHHLTSKYKWSTKIPNEKVICDPGPVPSKGLLVISSCHCDKYKFYI